MTSSIRSRVTGWVACLAFAQGFAQALPAPVPLTAAQERNQWNQPVPEWSQGPVRYALTSAEEREFRSLKTSADRAGFIARFWASRDPDPYTPGNAAEETFWKRVSSADELFATTTLAGWRTDRGRIYVILGPPDEIATYAVPSVGELDPTHWQDGIRRGALHDLPLGQRGAVEWIYRSLPNPEAMAGETITFVKNATGEFELSQSLNAAFRYEPPVADHGKYASSRSGGAVLSPGQAANRFEDKMRSFENLSTWAKGTLFEKMDPTIAPEGRVSASEFFGMFPVRHGIAFFRGDGGTVALLAVGVPADIARSAENSELEIFGSLERTGDPPQAYQFSSKRPFSDRWPVQKVQGEDQVLFEVRGLIPPGTYHVSFSARAGERAGSGVATVVAPDFSGSSLILGGPVLAEDLGPSPDGEAAGPFSIGQLRVVPKLGADYMVGSDFGFYFQVYDAALQEGRPHLDIYYSVAARSEGIYRPLGKPVAIEDNQAPSHAYRVTLKGWPVGEYLLTVTVKDRIGGAVASGTAGFRVVPAPP
ncbi:MAG TPA: GWxTD domain-containing protein [Candidatus Polarisedimenticolia bacterium]|nr:GWxTD domain-containing protein [Candidatus Polarisedimenticolia bacterium]